MTRIVRRPVQAAVDADGSLQWFRDGEVTHRVVDVIGRWSEMGAWWRGEGTRQVQRVLDEDGGVFDVECAKTEWWLYRVWD